MSWSGSVEAVSQWSAAMLVQEYDISGTRTSRLSGHESVRQTSPPSPPPRYFKHAARPASRNGRQQVLRVAAAYPRSTRLSAMPATSFPFPPQAPYQWRCQRVDVQKLCNMCVLSLSWNFFVSHDKYQTLQIPHALSAGLNPRVAPCQNLRGGP